MGNMQKTNEATDRNMRSLPSNDSAARPVTSCVLPASMMKQGRAGLSIPQIASACLSMKTTIALLAIALLSSLVFTGCKLRVPQTKLAIDLNKKKLTYSSPKDLGITNLVVRVETNGVFSVSVSNLTAATSAELVKEVGIGQELTARGTAGIIKNSGEAGAKVGNAVGKIVNPTTSLLERDSTTSTNAPAGNP